MHRLATSEIEGGPHWGERASSGQRYFCVIESKNQQAEGSTPGNGARIAVASRPSSAGICVGAPLGGEGEWGFELDEPRAGRAPRSELEDSVAERGQPEEEVRLDVQAAGAYATSVQGLLRTLSERDFMEPDLRDAM
jgi:hypothetical protein